MNFIFIIQIFIISWLIKAFKSALFWIYLWQLKEYHVGRLLDHFRTYKGKKTIFNFFVVLKVVLLFSALYSTNLFYLSFLVLFFIYILELVVFLKSVLLRSLKIPKFTLKTVLLTAVSFVLVILFLFWAAELYLQEANWIAFFAFLLIFDILSPLIISLAVLIFQPFFVLFRSSILQKARKKMEQFKDLTVVGITGSYGKTSTKEFLTTILSQKFNVLSTKEHQNSEIGIAQTILKDLNKNQEIFVVEMGSYKKGGISLLSSIVKPKIGVVTGVNEQHLATFGSMENLLSAEGGRELAGSLPKGGSIILNGDNKYCLDLYKRIMRYGLPISAKIYTAKKGKIDSDIWAEDITVKKDSISFVFVSNNKEAAHFNVNVLGSHNVQNILSACLVARELGMNLEEITRAIKNIKQEQAGMLLKKGVHGINIIDSSYSSNPDGVIAELDYLNVFSEKKVIVMPCLIELGKESEKIHENIGKKIAKVCDMAIVTTKERLADIKRGAILNGMPENKIIFSENPKEIFNIITTFCKEDDAVLLEGRVPGSLINLLKER